jgi:tetratricopeptide (TPR) repeat protein
MTRLPVEACVQNQPLTGMKTALIWSILITLLIGLAVPVAPVHAAQWHRITGTARYAVDLEMESVRQNDFGALTVLLRFTPHGEAQRRVAGERYGNRNYALHLERHEVDCSERSSRLVYLDILGWRENRLSRIPGGNRHEAIIPDSVLDRVADLVCPEDGSDEDEGDGDTAQEMATDKSSPHEQLLSPESLKRINDAQRRTVSEPGSFSAWVELGNAWYDAEIPRQAIEAYDRALALKPDDSDVLNDQGAMYRQSGDVQRAVANFEKALAIDPENLESMYNLGYVYAFDLNRMDRALEIWQRYLNMDSTSETAEQIRSFIRQNEEGIEKR